ncbi:MAG TPA: prenyltransferase/squalene oxidase repeat-containing protein [Blastocatellia bacterium]|nr:prenyltransferase/squalene oxidase repeat-containing protein [Blastocatellia bacterium]
MDSFLLRLTQRLTVVGRELEPERAARHRDSILSFQRADGGFAGREGGSDLYYTSFAVRGLALLEALDGSRSRLLAGYLKSAAVKGRYSLIDLVSWFYSVITVQLAGGPAAFEGETETLFDEIASALESFRRPDGGYAKTHEGGVGSTYHTFLAVICYEMLGRTPPETAAITQFLRSRRRDDGGFVEIGPMKRSGTNPTAAAAVLLKRFEALDQDLRTGIDEYLGKVRGLEGGFQANTQIPFCDLLSTFTGLLTASELGLDHRIEAAACRAYLDQLELTGGGFRGATWDQETDPEYTFYGLGSLALLRVSPEPPD